MPIVPNRDIRRLPPNYRPLPINQATSEEPFFPALTQIYAPVPAHTHSSQGPPAPFAERTSDSDDPAPIRAQPLCCYYPEVLYLSTALPTRKPQELYQFFEHCHLLYTNRIDPIEHIVIDHPLNEARSITSSPLNFQGLLWRKRIVLAATHICEEYHWIHRQIRPGRPDRAYLVPAYSIKYIWHSNGWTVTNATGTRFA